MNVSIAKRHIIRWIEKHDECRFFIISYIALAVLLSLFISLFWLVFVVFIHFCLEIFKQRTYKHKSTNVFLNSLWETKLDIALVIFALALGVYLEFIIGIAGIGAGARAVAQTGSRFAIWQRIIRGILISLDDLAQVLRFTKPNKNNKESSPTRQKVNDKLNLWRNKWDIGDIISVSFGILMLVLLLLAPYITQKSINEILLIMADDLHPWP